MWQKYLDRQYRRPSGLVGRWIGGKMAQQHRPENQWTVNLLGVQPTDYILEIGFGPGIAVEQIAQQAAHGLIVGIDFSPTMLAAASRRNAAAIREGRVVLRYADAARLPCPDAMFDKAFSIHSIYFWRDPLAALREIRRVLKPHGQLVLTVLPKEQWNPTNPELAGTPDCKPYSGAELRDMLSQAGFAQSRVEADTNPTTPSNFSVIAQK